MKKRTLMLGLAGLAFALVGCGGGGSSDNGGDTPPPSTKYYSVCVSKADSTSYSCLETCSDTTIDVGSYDSVDTCTVAGDQWIAKFNHSDIPSTQEQSDGLVWINNIRRGTGLPEFQYNSKLEKATLAHENYLGDVMTNYNVNMTHYEDNETYPSGYYTGVEGTDRALAAGYTGRWAGDVVGWDYNTVVESLEGLMSMIYHRQALLWNNTNEIGVGGTERKFSFKVQPHLMGLKADREDYLRSISPVVVAYPFDGQTNVMREFKNNEYPDPLPESNDWVGYPISLDFNSYYVSSVEISYFKLYNDDTGTEITNTKLLDKDTDPNDKFTEYQFALFPLDVLDSNTTYRVEVGYVMNGESGVKEWSFTTR